MNHKLVKTLNRKARNLKKAVEKGASQREIARLAKTLARARKDAVTELATEGRW